MNRLDSRQFIHSIQARIHDFLVCHNTISKQWRFYLLVFLFQLIITLQRLIGEFRPIKNGFTICFSYLDHANIIGGIVFWLKNTWEVRYSFWNKIRTRAESESELKIVLEMKCTASTVPIVLLTIIPAKHELLMWHVSLSEVKLRNKVTYLLFSEKRIESHDIIINKLQEIGNWRTKFL